MKPTNNLDDILTQAFSSFLAELPSDWHAKERDCVSRFVFGYLIHECKEGTAVESPAQLGIEVAVKQPAGVGEKEQHTKTLLSGESLFRQAGMKTSKLLLFRTPSLNGRLSEKVRREKTAHDIEWLEAFSIENPESVGYSTYLRFPKHGFW